MSSSSPRPFSEIPGPSALQLVRLLPKINTSVSEVIAELIEGYGPLVALRKPGADQIFLGRPEEITRVMATERERYPKGKPVDAFLPIGGDDPFVQAGGEAWQKARAGYPLSQPAAGAVLEAASPGLRALVRAHAERWAQTKEVGAKEVGAWEAALRLGFDFLAQLTVGRPLDEELYQECFWLAELVDQRMRLELVAEAPPIWPRGRAKDLLERLGAFAAQALARDPAGPHLLSLFAAEGEPPPSMALGRLLMNVLLAGAISAPTALLWTLLRLEEHPDVAARLDDALEASPGGFPPYLEGVLREALRLHPPVQAWLREVGPEEGVELGGYHLPQGTQLMMSPLALHLHEPAWPEAERFRPERWDEGLIAARPFGSDWLCPFGRGPRSCAGEQAALLFLRLCLTTLREGWRIGVEAERYRKGFFFACTYPEGIRLRLEPRSEPRGGDARRPPSLPQDDPEPERREAERHAIAAQYAIDLEKMPPLALCEGVPKPEAASVRWFLQAGKVIAPIMANMASVRVAVLKSKAPLPPTADASQESKSGLPAEAVGRAVKLLGELEAKDPRDIDKLHQRATPLLRALGVSSEETLREKVDGALRFVLSGGVRGALGTFEEDKPIYAYRGPDSSPRGASARDFEGLHQHLPLPAAAEDLHGDASFARRRITGPNPNLLRRIEALPEDLPVTDADLSRATAEGDSLEAAAAEGRLFLLDHRPIEGLLEPRLSTRGEPMFLYAPMTLFATPPTGDKGARGALRPVAIQCAPRPGPETPLLTPADGWAWRMGRYVVEVADMGWFEAITHLGLTHLLVEPAAIATRRLLAPNHPLSLLLRPHFEGTISVNDMAIHNLAADEGAIDQTFSATIASIRGLAARSVRGHDLRRDTLPARLARHGLDDKELLPDHPFRDDSLRIRGAIEGWVRAYLGHAYRAEGALAADLELRAWAGCLAGPLDQGGIGGFGAVERLEDLVEVVTELIFIASAGHAAVNFAQWTDGGFAPRMTGACWGPAPTRKEGYAEADWLAMLPPLDRAELGIEFLYLLGTLYYSRLGRYEDPDGAVEAWFTDPVVRRELLPAFQRSLAEVEAHIEADNADRGRRAAPYLHLMPSRIPQSINV